MLAPIFNTPDINQDTYMNPHLEYAQAIPGRTPGRFIGVIDANKEPKGIDAAFEPVEKGK